VIDLGMDMIETLFVDNGVRERGTVFRKMQD
jgi:hypothetical protein